jgi:hypothetical protein
MKIAKGFTAAMLMVAFMASGALAAAPQPGQPGPDGKRPPEQRQQMQKRDQVRPGQCQPGRDQMRPGQRGPKDDKRQPMSPRNNRYRNGHHKKAPKC